MNNIDDCVDCVYIEDHETDSNNMICQKCVSNHIPEVCHSRKCSIKGCMNTAKIFIMGSWYCQEHGLNRFFRRP